ncbi:protein of unknown function DUF81 [Thermosinus carboxydivorans Nor1]|uniref:Probable membrane transporter protein n=1 Tax=Thermosinus carboxydivorans Nor1 TaxID=401526 RepID=A1HLR5_9FIRM|nr:sulfite exporter TauE/SafE family protein [Thermosinus carboxydivorans]EAX48772.1 protein of unknown function DUF81 [Thermosinus carboxydivorans Nor1]
MFTLSTLYIFAVVVFAGFLQTLTGFGYALAAAPLLAFAMNPKEVVLFILFSGLIIKAALTVKTWHVGRVASVMPIFLASLVGALPGAIVLRYISDSALKLFIGIVLLAATAAMNANIRLNIRRHGLAKAVTGLISGFLASTTSLNGPPVVLYYMNEGENKDILRANLARYFLLGNSASFLMSVIIGGVQLSKLVAPMVLALPGLLIGFWLGEKLFSRLDAAHFRRIGLAVISVSGLMMAGSGLWPYIAPQAAKVLSRFHL